MSWIHVGFWFNAPKASSLNPFPFDQCNNDDDDNDNDGLIDDDVNGKGI